MGSPSAYRIEPEKLASKELISKIGIDQACVDQTARKNRQLRFSESKLQGSAQTRSQRVSDHSRSSHRSNSKIWGRASSRSSDAPDAATDRRIFRGDRRLLFRTRPHHRHARLQTHRRMPCDRLRTQSHLRPHPTKITFESSWLLSNYDFFGTQSCPSSPPK